MILRRQFLVFATLAVVFAFFITRTAVTRPAFTDAFYHLNAANRLVSGQGLTDPYLWTYIGAPDSLPSPSHLYWMPLTSLSAALGMKLLNAPGDYSSAQWPFALMYAGTACVGFWLGGKIGGRTRHAWIAGLLTLFSGYYMRFWGTIDTFAPYAIVGSLCLAFLALALEAQTGTRKFWLSFALAGVFSALAHLTRADGVLLLGVGWLVIVWALLLQRRKMQGKALQFLGAGLLMTFMYLLTMLPWFIRNANMIGTPMPLGGTQSIWFAEYNDLFNYPPNASPATLLADGVGKLLSTRWEAFAGPQGIFSGNLGTLVAVEGMVIVLPLMLVGLWKRRHEDFLRPFWLYALGVHLAMTLIFPFPGYRGGLFHSAAALVPWWAALAVVGLDDCVDWISRRRRRWNAGTAKWIFSISLIVLAVFLSLSITLPNRVLPIEKPELYQELQAKLPVDARVMINDPAQLYYYTSLSGVVLPNEAPEVILEIAQKYDVHYLLLEGVSENGQEAEAASPKLWSLLTATPDFLTLIPLDNPDVRLYEIHF